MRIEKEEQIVYERKRTDSFQKNTFFQIIQITHRDCLLQFCCNFYVTISSGIYSTCALSFPRKYSLLWFLSRQCHFPTIDNSPTQSPTSPGRQLNLYNSAPPSDPLYI